MSIPNYTPRSDYVGTGALDTYTFDFKITDKSQLSIVKVDDTGTLVWAVDGNDLTYLSSVSFNDDGGGQVVLVAALPTDYTLALILNAVEPTQPSQFARRSPWTLKQFEDAMDFIALQLQSLAYKVNRAPMLGKLVTQSEADAFDTEIDLVADSVVAVNPTGDGFTTVPLSSLGATGPEGPAGPAGADGADGYSPSSSYEISNLGLATSVGSNALTIALKQSDGSTDPSTGNSAVKVGMRSSTLTSGLYNQRSVTNALSLVISSGSTLGHTSGNAHKIWIYLIDNAGTLELAASQTLFPETQLITTVSEGGAGAADSNSVVYSTTARTSVPHRVIGCLTSTQTTAGTWAANMTQVQVGEYGGLSATDTVAAKVDGNDSTSLSSTVVVVKGGTVAYDTHGMINTATGAITIPVAGLYDFTVQASNSAVTTADNQYFNFELRTGSTANAGTVKGNVYQRQASGLYSDMIPATIPLNCLAGDVYSWQVKSDFGASRALQNDGFYAVKKIK